MKMNRRHRMKWTPEVLLAEVLWAARAIPRCVGPIRLAQLVWYDRSANTMCALTALLSATTGRPPPSSRGDAGLAVRSLCRSHGMRPRDVDEFITGFDSRKSSSSEDAGAAGRSAFYLAGTIARDELLSRMKR